MFPLSTSPFPRKNAFSRSRSLAGQVNVLRSPAGQFKEVNSGISTSGNTTNRRWFYMLTPFLLNPISKMNLILKWLNMQRWQCPIYYNSLKIFVSSWLSFRWETYWNLYNSQYLCQYWSDKVTRVPLWIEHCHLCMKGHLIVSYTMMRIKRRIQIQN